MKTWYVVFVMWMHVYNVQPVNEKSAVTGDEEMDPLAMNLSCKHKDQSLISEHKLKTSKQKTTTGFGIIHVCDPNTGYAGIVQEQADLKGVSGQPPQSTCQILSQLEILSQTNKVCLS